MNSLRSKIRWIVTAGLMLSLSVTGLSPHLVAWDGAVSVLRTADGEALCCCGTEDDRCCGLGCCYSADPNQGKTPTAPDRSNVQPGCLAGAVESLAATGNRRGFHDLFGEVPSSASRSLIALSIRLNC